MHRQLGGGAGTGSVRLQTHGHAAWGRVGDTHEPGSSARHEVRVQYTQAHAHTAMPPPPQAHSPLPSLPHLPVSPLSLRGGGLQPLPVLAGAGAFLRGLGGYGQGWGCALCLEGQLSTVGLSEPQFPACGDRPSPGYRRYATALVLDWGAESPRAPRTGVARHTSLPGECCVVVRHAPGEARLGGARWLAAGEQLWGYRSSHGDPQELAFFPGRQGTDTLG